MRQLLILLLLIFTHQVWGQRYVVSVDHWGVEDGLSHRFTTRILPDSRGFIWVGTFSGLNRFDGYNFRWFTREKDSLQFNDIGDMIEDTSGNIWVKARTTAFLAKINKITKKTEVYSEGKFPVKTKNGALPDSSFVMGYWRNLFYTIRGDEYVLNPILTLPADENFLNITERNTVWSFRNNSEIIERDYTGKVLRKATLPEELPERMVYGYKPGWGNYFGDSSKASVYYVDTFLQVHDITKQLPPRVPGIFDVFFYTGIDDVIWRQGKIWSLSSGLIRDLRREGVENHRPPPGIVYSRNGHIWYTASFGFYHVTITRNKFKHYFDKNYDSSRKYAFRGLKVIGDTLYTSAEDSGIYACRISGGPRDVRKLYRYKYFDAYTDLIRLRNGNILCGRRSSMYETDLNTGKTKTHEIPIGDHTNCWSLYEVADGRVLIGLEEGLKWLDVPSSQVTPFMQYRHFPDLAKAYVLDIVPDRNRDLLLCTNKGLYRYNIDSGITARYSPDDTGRNHLPAVEIQHVYHDKDGIYWVAATSGLIRWDYSKGTTRLYTRSDGLSNNNIYAIYEDSQDRLWLSSDYGIMQFRKSNASVLSFLVEDGITDNEFNRISHTSDSAGNIYFGSLAGVTAFHPDDFPVTVDNSLESAPLAITSFMQFDGEQNTLIDKTADLLLSNNILLRPDDRFFTLEFALLNFHQKGTLYYWKIDEADTGWNVQLDRTIRLSRLPYGKSTLHIKAQEANGNWSRNELSISIFVEKPLYLQPWFGVLFTLFVITIIVIIYRWRVDALAKENTRLDSVVKEKTNDLQRSLNQKDLLLKEIHHRVKNNLQVISSLLRLQARSVDDQGARNALIEGQNRVASIALIHQKLYQNEDLDKVEFSKFVDDLYHHLEGVFNSDARHVKLVNKIPICFFDIDRAVPLALILNELFTNSYKYAVAGNPHPQISVSITQSPEHTTLEFADNGPGLPAPLLTAPPVTLGLKLISRLCTQINARVSYHNNNGLVCVIQFANN
jgi:two-component sensor histidine kinase